MARTGPRPHSSPEQQSRRRKALVVLAVFGVLGLGWFGIVAALAGGGGGTAQQAGGDSESGQPPPASETTATEGAEEEQEATTREDSATDGAKEAGSEQEQTEQAAPPPENWTEPEDETANGSDDSGSDDSGSSGSGSSGSGSSGSSEDGSEQPSPTTDGSNEGQEQPRTTEVDTASALAASKRYLRAAYGYTGNSAQDYLRGIDEAASPEVYDSPGGSKLKDYAQAAPECGMISNVALERFEVMGQSPEGIGVIVIFSVDDSDGQTHQFRQLQRLAGSPDAYEVAEVSVEELISESTPQESCPGGGAGQQSTPENSTTEESSTGGGADGGSEEGSGQEESSWQGQDPLGENPSPGELTDTEKARVESTADRFITSAYGYSGDSSEEYREGLSQAALLEALYSTEGGKRLERYEQAAGEDGLDSAAVMERFEITETTTEPRQVQGVAYFRVGDEYNQNSELEGETTAYKQELTLSPAYSTYKVSVAGVEQQIPESQLEGGN